MQLQSNYPGWGFNLFSVSVLHYDWYQLSIVRCSSQQKELYLEDVALGDLHQDVPRFESQM
jgi:hypothetical protein